MVRDVVCRMELDPAESAGEVVHEGTTYYFCSPGCLDTFKADEDAYVKRASP